MSLTSLSGGYGYAPPRAHRLPPTPKQPIFYDYSEDFEGVTQPPPICPIAPIPKRVSNPYRPVNIQANCDSNSESMDEAQHEFVAYLQEATMSELPKGNDCKGNRLEDSQSEFCQADGHVQSTAHDAGMEHNLRPGLSSSEAVHVVDFGTTAPSIRGECNSDGESNPDDLSATEKVVITEPKSDSSTLDDPPEPETPAFTTNMPLEEVLRFKEDLTNGMDLLDEHLVNHNVDPHRGTSEERLYSATSAQSGDTKPLQVDGVASLPYMSSNRCHDSRVYSLSSGLSDLASFVNQVDKHFQEPGPSSHDRHSVEAQHDTEGEAREYSTIAPLEFAAVQCENDKKYSANETSHPPRVSSLRQYRRHHTELRVDTGIGDAQQYQVVSTRSGPTLVPQPISPAKLLRVKNSIPQLMKALPPLPDYDPAPESPFGPAPLEFEQFELSRLTDARSSLSDAVMCKNRDEKAPKIYDPYVFDQKARKPKLKLRHAASFAHEQSRGLRRGYMKQHGFDTRHDTSDKRPATATEYSTAPMKRRLPIKITRPTFTSLMSEDTGTVKRRPGFPKSSTVSGLASTQPIDLFSSSTGLHIFPKDTGSPSTRHITPETSEQASAPVIEVTHVSMVQKVPLDAADARGSSLDAHLNSLRLPDAKDEAAAEGGMQSFFSDNSLVKPHRGLKKRISDLRSRLTEPRHHHRSPLWNMLRDDRNDGTNTLLAAESQSTNTFKNLLSSLSQPKTHSRVNPSRKVRSKLESFVNVAKHRLRSWGKAKHTRSD